MALDKSYKQIVKMMKNRLLANLGVAAMMALPTSALALTGKVTSNGEPLIGVTIQVVGTTNGTTTDFDGNYAINLEDDATIDFSYVGYLMQEVEVDDDDTVLDIDLQEDTQSIEEVVVLGYGANTRKQDLSASVGVISNMDELASRPVSSTAAMLQGQIAGVSVSADSGDPTKGMSVVIRGQGSQNGDNVLWVVDGIPGAPVPVASEIENIVVLKDAASAAIYGAQSGAGGVVLVTTKKAKGGEPSVSYDGVYGVRNAVNLPEALNAEEQILMRQLSHKNAGLSVPSGWDVNVNPWIGETRTDWMDEIFRAASYQRHNVALNFGAENFSNRLSYTMDSNDGVLIDTYKKTNTIRYNTTYKLNKWVSISEDLTWNNVSSRGIDTDSGYTGAVLSAIYMPASATVYNPLDGSYGGTTTEDPDYIAKYGSNFADIHGDTVNPVRLLSADTNYNVANALWSTTSMEVGNIAPGLKFVSRFSYNINSNYYKNFTPIRDEVGKPNLSNTLNESTYRTSTWKSENTLTYDKTFGDHTIGALLSTTADHYENRGFSVTGKTFADESEALQYLAYAADVTGTDYLTGPDANVSFIGRLAYSYDDRYFVTGSFRRDYAGRLPDQNNYGNFPATTLAWKLSNEEFFPETNFIDLVKLRASWGRVGNLGSIGMNYKSSNLATNTSSNSGQFGVGAGGSWGTSIFNNTAVNPNLTWETSEQTDFGLDVAMFDNRLSMTFDYFDKRTFNLIQTQTMNWPSTIGVNAMLVNQGEVRNRGFEAQLGWNESVNGDFSYYVNGNFSYLKNWVSDIGVKDAAGNPGVWRDSYHFRNLSYIYQTAEGQPLSSFYLVKTAGIFQSDEEAKAYVGKDGKPIQPNAVAGDLKFIDANDDGVINDSDRQYCGNATPEFTYALSLGFTYKNLSMSAMLQGVAGAQTMYIAKNMLLSDIEGNFNRSKEILNAWSPENTGSNIPRLSKSDPNGNFTTMSDWYLEDSSYIRLKNLTVSYNLTNLIRKNSHFSDRNSRLAVDFSGENLFTITNYSGMDPECGGLDALKYPVSRVLSFGVRLTY